MCHLQGQVDLLPIVHLLAHLPHHTHHVLDLSQVDDHDHILAHLQLKAYQAILLVVADLCQEYVLVLLFIIGMVVYLLLDIAVL